MEKKPVHITHTHAAPRIVYTQAQKRLIVLIALIAFAMLYLGMRLAGMTLAVWW